MKMKIAAAASLAFVLAACGDSAGSALKEKMIAELSKGATPEAAECLADAVVARLSDQQKAIQLARADYDAKIREADKLNEEERKKKVEEAEKAFQEAREKNGAKEDKDYDKIRAQIRRIMNDEAPKCIG